MQEVGRILLELNEARKDIERGIIADVQKQIDSGAINIETDNIIIATSSSWPPGVIGLVASRFVSKYGKPTLLFHETKEGVVKRIVQINS